MRVATGDGRHFGPGKRTPFTRHPAEPVLVFFARGRRQKCQRRAGSDSGAREENALTLERPERRSGKRAVKRGSPQSRLHRRAPSLPVPCIARLPTGGGRCESAKNERRSRGRARSRKAPGREWLPERASKRIERCIDAEEAVTALGKRRNTGARVTVSKCRSRSDATFGRDARNAPQARPRTRAT